MLSFICETVQENLKNVYSPFKALVAGVCVSARQDDPRDWLLLANYASRFSTTWKKWKLFFLATAQRIECNMRSTIFRSNLQKKTLVQWGPNGCIKFLWAGAKKYKFSYLLCAGPLNQFSYFLVLPTQPSKFHRIFTKRYNVLHI